MPVQALSCFRPYPTSGNLGVVLYTPPKSDRRGVGFWTADVATPFLFRHAYRSDGWAGASGQRILPGVLPCTIAQPRTVGPLARTRKEKPAARSAGMRRPGRSSSFVFQGKSKAGRTAPSLQHRTFTFRRNSRLADTQTRRRGHVRSAFLVGFPFGGGEDMQKASWLPRRRTISGQAIPQHGGDCTILGQPVRDRGECARLEIT